MKKYLLFALACLFVTANPVWAQKAGDLGVGIIVGNPTGATGKLWLGDSHAIDFGVGFSSRLTLYADYLIHSWTILPQPAEGKLPVYVALGAQVRTFDDTELGLRALVGIAYWFPRDPLELFLEVGPVFRIEPHNNVGLDAGLGLRYYFGRAS